MNYLQFLLFFLYCVSNLSAGVGLYRIVNPENRDYMNRAAFIGEALLLGSILLIGEMVALSILGLYSTVYLWGCVVLNFSFLRDKGNLQQFRRCFSEKISWDVPVVALLGLTAFFVFRNCFFLVDVDSHSTYLFAQKLWLENATSVFGGPGYDMRIFVPHFNAVPYALGLSLFPKETLFPQLIVVSWTLIAVLLVFGYTSYRFNRYFGLGAVMLVLFNDHIFYSGANSCCIINSALIALLFAATYNFWEGRVKKSGFRFFLALIFLSQLMANKYQMFYITVFILVFGLGIQENLFSRIKEVFSDKKKVMALLGAAAALLLWYLKNFLATGIPTFPILAGTFGIFNWTPEMTDMFNKAYGGPVSFLKFIKYMNYMFIWPGINASKIIIIVISFFPVLFVVAGRKHDFNREEALELCFWLGVSILMVMGLCLVSFLDPRHYRYFIAAFAFSSILSINYIFKHIMSFKKEVVIGAVILLLSLPGYNIMYSQEGTYKRPAFKDNVNVLLNKLHFEDVAGRYYPENAVASAGFEEDNEKAMNGAWDTGIAGVTPLSAFLLPTRPQVGLWHTTVVKWDSYQDRDLIIQDVTGQGIEWVMRVENDTLVFLSPKQYAREAAEYDRYPENKFYNYGFPQELAEIGP